MAEDTRLFKSRPAIQAYVTKLLDAYAHFAVNMVDAQLGNPNFTPRAAELRAIRHNTEGFVQRATELMADPDFELLTPDEQDDVRAIAEESQVALVEIDEASDPDVVWQGMARSHKDTATAMHPVDRQKVDKVRSRLKHDIRRQAPQPPDPDKPKHREPSVLLPRDEINRRMTMTLEENIGGAVPLSNDEGRDPEPERTKGGFRETQSPPFTSPENTPEAPTVVDERIAERENKASRKKLTEEE